MKDMDRNLRQHIQKESEDMLFSQMDLSDRVKQRIRGQAALEKPGRRFAFPRTWIIGTAALAVAVMIFVGFPLFQQSAEPVPSESQTGNLPSTNEGVVGSELSQLISTPLSTVEEAKAAFGPGLLVPSVVPEGFTLSEMVAVGMKGEPARDVVITYMSGEKTINYSASRLSAGFPMDLFTPTQVNGVEGYVFEQPELTELYWKDGDIQYSVVGQLSAEEAMKVAKSIER